LVLAAIGQVSVGRGGVLISPVIDNIHTNQPEVAINLGDTMEAAGSSGTPLPFNAKPPFGATMRQQQRQRKLQFFHG
jgi:hypothetical protein